MYSRQHRSSLHGPGTFACVESTLSLLPRLLFSIEPVGRNTYYVHISKYEKVGVLPIRIVKSNVSSIGKSKR